MDPAGRVTVTTWLVATAPIVLMAEPLGPGALLLVRPLSVQLVAARNSVPPCGPGSVTTSRSRAPVTDRPASPDTSKRKYEAYVIGFDVSPSRRRRSVSVP